MLTVLLSIALTAAPDAGQTPFGGAPAAPVQPAPSTPTATGPQSPLGTRPSNAAVVTPMVVRDGGLGQYLVVSSDGGFAVDAGERGIVIDQTDPDGGVSTAAAVAPQVTVRILGALVLPAEVYLDMLKLKVSARPNEATAKEIQEQLAHYLHRVGFELARVSTRVVEGGIEATIDEGKVDRIIFLGQMSFQQVRFKLALVLPYEVFNRPLLDRQVRELADALGMPGVRWELVHTASVDHAGPQVTSIPAQMDMNLAGAEMVHERRPYEVRISFADVEGSYFGLEIKSNYVNGLETGLNYTGRDLLGKGDVWYVATSGGVGLRSRILTEKLYPHFSRAYFEAQYSTVPLLKYFRPNLWAETNLSSRQRADLFVENYWAWTADAALQLQVEARPGLRFLVGAGFEFRKLFGLEVVPDFQTPPDVTVTERNRPFIRAIHESVFDPTVLRWDRRHTIESELRYYFPLQNEQGFGWADLRYQFVRPIGWHDFWVKARGHLSWGEVTFHDELSVAELTRGLFGAQWVPSGATLQLEFRFSLVRDDIKVGVFHDLAVFAVPLRTQGKAAVELANGFGPSLHFLAMDMFQLDLFMAFGFRRNANFNAAFSMQFQKAF